MIESVEVIGLEEARKKLDQVEAKVSIKVIRAALRFAMKPTIDVAKSLVLYDSSSTDDGYHLRDTIGLRSESKKNRRGNATMMRFGAHRQTLPAGDPSGYRIAAGHNKSIKAPNHAKSVNYIKPFLEPAVEQTSPVIVRRFGEKIVQSVSKL